MSASPIGPTAIALVLLTAACSGTGATTSPIASGPPSPSRSPSPSPTIPIVITGKIEVHYGRADLNQCISLIASHNPARIVFQDKNGTVIGTTQVVLLAGQIPFLSRVDECSGAETYSVQVPKQEFYQAEVDGISAGAISDSDLVSAGNVFDIEVTV